MSNGKDLTAFMAGRMSGSTKTAGDNFAAPVVSEDFLAKLAAEIDQDLAGETGGAPTPAPVPGTTVPTALPDAATAVSQTQPIVDASSAAAGGRPDLVAQAAAPVQAPVTTDTNSYGTMDDGSMQDKATMHLSSECCLTPEETVKVAAEARVFYAEMQKIAMEEALPGAIEKLASYGMIHASVNLTPFFSKEADDNYIPGDTLTKLASGELQNPTAEDLVIAAAEFDKLAEEIAEAELAGEAQAYADVEKLAAEIEAEEEAEGDALAIEDAIEAAYRLGAEEAAAQTGGDIDMAQLMADPDFVALAKKYGN